jgi:hypothetical protein
MTRSVAILAKLICSGFGWLFATISCSSCHPWCLHCPTRSWGLSQAWVSSSWHPSSFSSSLNLLVPEPNSHSDHGCKLHTLPLASRPSLWNRPLHRLFELSWPCGNLADGGDTSIATYYLDSFACLLQIPFDDNLPLTFLFPLQSSLIWRIGANLVPSLLRKRPFTVGIEEPWKVGLTSWASRRHLDSSSRRLLARLSFSTEQYHFCKAWFVSPHSGAYT